MTERFTVDTNILFYAADRDAGIRHERALLILDRAVRCDCVLALQALAEFFHAVTRKGIVPRGTAARYVEGWMTIFPTIAADEPAFRGALGLAASGQVNIWDAMLLATARQAGCRVLLSEDMHDGAVHSGLRIRNPFAGPSLPADVERLLGGTQSE